MVSQENIQKLVAIIRVAGRRAKEIRRNNLKIESKSDGSQVTNADKELDNLFSNFIKNEINNKELIISEEDVGNGNLPEAFNNESFWSIDPIDSTTSFISGNPFWSLNIAYIKDGIPFFGLIHSPERDITWYGSVDYGAFRQIGEQEIQKISVRKVSPKGAVLMSSEEQEVSQDFKQEFNIIKEIKIPSSIKFTYIAEGIADYYTRNRNKACEWDIASGHALILAAGGSVEFTKESEEFVYGKPPYLAPSLLAKGKTV